MNNLLLFIIFAVILLSCKEYERQDVSIKSVQKDTSWLYKQINPILFERQFYVLIDGELDADAALESQSRIFGLKDKEKQNVLYVNYRKLPKGKFSLYSWHDYAGPEKFIFHSLNTKNGYITIKIRPGFYRPDSTRKEVESINERSGVITVNHTDL